MDRETFMTPAEAAERWGLTTRRVRQLCKSWRFFGQQHLETGEWLIPKKVDRPVDTRAYHYRKVPKAFFMWVHHLDAVREAARQIPEYAQYTPEDRWLYFLRGAAHHMRTMGETTLNFSEVCRVIAGEHLPDRPEADQESVRRFCRALEAVRRAVQEKRRLTWTLLQEFYLLYRGETSWSKNWFRDESSLDEIEVLLRIARQRDWHPAVQAGDFLNEMFLKRPLKSGNEQLGYLVANFILMRNGYPPFILYRIVFAQVWRYQRHYAEMIAGMKWEHNLEDVFTGKKRQETLILPPKPELRRAFINVAVVRAITRACRQGFLALV